MEEYDVIITNQLIINDFTILSQPSLSAWCNCNKVFQVKTELWVSTAILDRTTAAEMTVNSFLTY